MDLQPKSPAAGPLRPFLLPAHSRPFEIEQISIDSSRRLAELSSVPRLPRITAPRSSELLNLPSDSRSIAGSEETSRRAPGLPADKDEVCASTMLDEASYGPIISTSSRSLPHHPPSPSRLLPDISPRIPLPSANLQTPVNPTLSGKASVQRRHDFWVAEVRKQQKRLLIIPLPTLPISEAPLAPGVKRKTETDLKEGMHSFWLGEIREHQKRIKRQQKDARRIPDDNAREDAALAERQKLVRVTQRLSGSERRSLKEQNQQAQLLILQQENEFDARKRAAETEREEALALRHEERSRNEERLSKKRARQQAWEDEVLSEGENEDEDARWADYVEDNRRYMWRMDEESPSRLPEELPRWEGIRRERRIEEERREANKSRVSPSTAQIPAIKPIPVLRPISTWPAFTRCSLAGPSAPLRDTIGWFQTDPSDAPMPLTFRSRNSTRPVFLIYHDSEHSDNSGSSSPFASSSLPPHTGAQSGSLSTQDKSTSSASPTTIRLAEATPLRSLEEALQDERNQLLLPGNSNFEPNNQRSPTPESSQLTELSTSPEAEGREQRVRRAPVRYGKANRKTAIPSTKEAGSGSRDVAPMSEARRLAGERIIAKRLARAEK